VGDVSLKKFLRRNEVEWSDVVEQLPELSAVDREVARQVSYDVKYEGYIARQQIEVSRQQRLANKRIPEGFDFGSMTHLRAEAREKLVAVRPIDLAQAGRISGVTPADIALIMVHLEGKGRRFDRVD
jgi:tRNA uridine 5-carboxymethylaminomethyl modification enzyme